MNNDMKEFYKFMITAIIPSAMIIILNLALNG